MRSIRSGSPPNSSFSSAGNGGNTGAGANLGTGPSKFGPGRVEQTVYLGHRMFETTGVSVQVEAALRTIRGLMQQRFTIEYLQDQYDELKAATLTVKQSAEAHEDPVSYAEVLQQANNLVAFWNEADGQTLDWIDDEHVSVGSLPRPMPALNVPPTLYTHVLCKEPPPCEKFVETDRPSTEALSPAANRKRPGETSEHDAVKRSRPQAATAAHAKAVPHIAPPTSQACDHKRLSLPVHDQSWPAEAEPMPQAIALAFNHWIECLEASVYSGQTLRAQRIDVVRKAFQELALAALHEGRVDVYHHAAQWTVQWINDVRVAAMPQPSMRQPALLRSPQEAGLLDHAPQALKAQLPQ